ncbi:hypothetical protein TPHA_0A02540 [Tetrapisispora phaffii CBS 4417]|uniref:ubiquitinyl hydrolase 1 n=1 Tax=Tetrapisispora phaffii (strain ATCC 24235 / CBS 4417 / NBRC 1672 / NRRL Y-8282 / UCD 70-5) TaxID=1071381 RepID=G8BN59_TETPH|nr:hypothetical protein TPHA_0A02540 [Tetrapisispora phaffii CBS 4417]CCE61337.1 hypothetical protein TPHA_0A02540 [Tetrapisispora phaffii CBS 4417]
MLHDTSQVSVNKNDNKTKDALGNSDDSVSDLSHEFALLNDNKEAANFDIIEDNNILIPMENTIETEGQMRTDSMSPTNSNLNDTIGNSDDKKNNDNSSSSSSADDDDDDNDGDDDNNNIVTNEDYEYDDTMDKQREMITELLKNNEEQAKEGDKVYIIPQFWYNTFMNPDLKDSTQLEPINTKIISKDYDNFVLNDYDICPYIALPENVFNKLMEWYGLDEVSQPIMTYLIKDEESNTLVPEYNKCIFRLHYLTMNLSQNKFQSTHYKNTNYKNNVVYLSLSRLSSLKDLMSKLLNSFFSIESELNIDKTDFKLWLVKDSEENQQDSVLNFSYRIDPLQFALLSNISRITIDTADKILKDINMFSGDIVIEIKHSNCNYHWLSNYFHYNPIQNGVGNVGLNNLGNTCYMNSALQCLAHIPPIRDYFKFGAYKNEINLDNPLGFQGNIANAFSALVQNLYKNQFIPSASYAPSQFKLTIGHYNQMFSGYFQQDSQEFLAFLLDGLHEDLNRIKDKPYVEKPSLADGSDVNDYNIIARLAADTLEAHLKRNDSIIIDLFVGLYKSTLKCPVCNHVSITFDPYCDLTLPIPVESVWNFKVKIFPQNSPPCIMEVELKKTSTYQELKEYVSNIVNIAFDSLYGCEIYNHQVFNYFESLTSSSRYLPIKELISDLDDIIFYELIVDPDKHMVFPVLNTLIDGTYKSPMLFGVPFFIVLRKEDLNNPGAIRKSLEISFSKLSGGFGSFPILLSKQFDPVTDGNFIKEKYDLNLDEVKDIYQYSNTSDKPTDCYFKIKIMDITNDKKCSNKVVSVLREEEDSKDVVDSLPEVWIPSPHINVSKSVDITSLLDPVVNDVYDLYSLTHDTNDTDEPSETMSEASLSPTFESNLYTTASKDSSYPTPKEGGSIEKALLLDSNKLIICEWNESSMREVFDFNPELNWEKPALIKNVELEKTRELGQDKEEKNITLEDSLNLFERAEVLGINDSWYCPKCKHHRQASKQIQLWSTPDILTIHLKRFETQGSFSDKIDDVVDFPINGLDLSKHILDKSTSQLNIYDLIAVDNHYGGLGGGHYTAYIKNLIDNKWYYFDDSRVSETVPERSVAGSAYLLFYMRRTSDGNVGGEKLNAAIRKGREEWEAQYTAFQAKQNEIYSINKTDDDLSSEEESDNENIQNDDDSNARDDKRNDMSIKVVNSGSMPLEQTKLRDYNIKSLEVGSNKSFDDNVSKIDVIENNSGRRKLRLLKKNYTSTEQIPSSPIKNSSSPNTYSELAKPSSSSHTESGSECTTDEVD